MNAPRPDNAHARSDAEITVGHIGELELVRRIRAWLPAHPNLLTGPGDDCAVLRPHDGPRITKTDAIVEGVHFLPEEEPKRVGHKALARALSDCAAMGATPLDALVTIGLRSDTPVAWVRGLYEGVIELAERWNVALAGGETTSSHGGPIWISIALNGRAPQAGAILRSGGSPGDSLWVTGTLGGSIAGKHLDFEPRLREADWLARHISPRAMMDVSDGLAKDLPRLAFESGCGWILDLSAVPKTPGSSVEAALSDGEDYELLFALDPDQDAAWTEAWRLAFPATPVTRIGELQASSVRIGLESPGGWEHFQRD